jgi:hypothetical protein
MSPFSLTWLDDESFEGDSSIKDNSGPSYYSVFAPGAASDSRTESRAQLQNFMCNDHAGDTAGPKGGRNYPVHIPEYQWREPAQ